LLSDLLDATRPAPEAALTLAEVDGALTEVAASTGAGSRARRLARLSELFARATAPERDFLVRLLVGELRQGALESLVLEALARASGVDAARIRRAVMLHGGAGVVGRSALEGGADLEGASLEVFRPVKP